jgi:cell wall-associated NlpC family hydrolase
VLKWLAATTVAAVVLPLALVFLVTAGTSASQASTGLAGGPSTLALADIPPAYLALYMGAAQTCPGLPWGVLAGIGKAESDHGRSTAPGVHSGANYAGAEGPMQFEPATFAEYAVDGDHDGTLNVYDPADAIYTAAAMLCANGAASGTQAGISQAVLAYNHSQAYVTDVLIWAARYTVPAPSGAAATAIAFALAQLGKPYLFSGGPGGEVTLNPRVCPAQKADANSSSDATGVVQAGLDPQQRCVAAAVILYAASQLGKPYQWGGTGPDAFDCSGLAMMAYRAAGIAIPRTSQQQWAAGPRVPPGQEQPGDLVFFAGSDGTPQAPGHVGIVIGNGEMIEAYATGYPIRIAMYGRPSSPPGDQVVPALPGLGSWAARGGDCFGPMHTGPGVPVTALRT